MQGYCRRYGWEMTSRDIEKMGCLDKRKQARHKWKKCKFFQPRVMINWSDITAEQVRAGGIKIDEIHTLFGSTYSAYRYRDHLVVIHEDDDDLAMVIKGGLVVWAHPVTERGLEKVRKAVN